MTGIDPHELFIGHRLCNEDVIVGNGEGCTLIGSTHNHAGTPQGQCIVGNRSQMLVVDIEGQ